MTFFCLSQTLFIFKKYLISKSAQSIKKSPHHDISPVTEKKFYAAERNKFNKQLILQNKA